MGFALFNPCQPCCTTSPSSWCCDIENIIGPVPSLFATLSCTITDCPCLALLDGFDVTLPILTFSPGTHDIVWSSGPLTFPTCTNRSISIFAVCDINFISFQIEIVNFSGPFPVQECVYIQGLHPTDIRINCNTILWNFDNIICTVHPPLASVCCDDQTNSGALSAIVTE